MQRRFQPPCGDCPACVSADTILFQVRVKGVQALGTDFSQFKTADGLVDSHQKVNIAVDGRGTHSPKGKQVEGITPSPVCSQKRKIYDIFLLLFLGALVVVFLYRLSKEEVTRMQRELDERNRMER